MDRTTRKDLKTDKFALEVGHTVEYIGAHRRQVLLFGGIATVALVIGIGLYFYQRQQHTVRQQELTRALKIRDGYVGQRPQGADSNLQWFESLEKRDEATRKALTDVIARHSGSDEADIAQYTLAVMAYDAGKADEAERRFRQVMDSGAKEYAALAKFTVAQIDAKKGRKADAEKLLRSLIGNPTVFVSKEQAELALIDVIAKDKPQEASKMLEPLISSSRPAISRAAVQRRTLIPPTPPTPPPAARK